MEREGETFRYVALWKPYMTLTSFEDDAPKANRKGRSERSTLLKFSLPRGLQNVGRLDRDSEGLLLLTDDGAFCHQVLQGGCSKQYLVLVLGHPTSEALAAMAGGGLDIRGRLTGPASVRLLPWAETQALLPLPHPQAIMLDAGNSSWLEVIISQGMNRQVRRTTQHAGHRTVRLVRAAVGALSVEDLKLQAGEWKFVEKHAVLGQTSLRPTPRIERECASSDGGGAPPRCILSDGQQVGRVTVQSDGSSGVWSEDSASERSGGEVPIRASECGDSYSGD